MRRYRWNEHRETFRCCSYIMTFHSEFAPLRNSPESIPNLWHSLLRTFSDNFLELFPDIPHWTPFDLSFQISYRNKSFTGASLLWFFFKLILVQFFKFLSLKTVIGTSEMPSNAQNWTQGQKIWQIGTDQRYLSPKIRKLAFGGPKADPMDPQTPKCKFYH